MRVWPAVVVVLAIASADCGRPRTEPTPVTSPAVVTTVAPDPAPETTAGDPSKTDIVPGPHRLTIDAASTGCGGLFSETLVIDGELVGGNADFTFGRKIGAPWHSFAPDPDRVDLHLKTDGTRLVGSLLLDRAIVTSPRGLLVANKRYTPDWKTSAIHYSTGIVSGVYAGQLTLIVEPIGPAAKREDCRAEFSWTLTRR